MVVVVAFDGVQLLDVTGPAEVFTTANTYGARYDVRVVSPTGTDVRTSSGVRIGADGALGEVSSALVGEVGRGQVLGEFPGARQDHVQWVNLGHRAPALSRRRRGRYGRRRDWGGLAAVTLPPQGRGGIAARRRRFARQARMSYMS